MAVHRTESLDEFLARAGDFLVRREAENNLIFGIGSQIRHTPEIFDPAPQFAVVTGPDGGVEAAALRTPPFNLVLAWADRQEATDELADAFAEDRLPGVLGPKATAARFVERWTAHTGRTGTVAVAERIYRLERLIPPARPASGAWRLAEPRDRETIGRWIVAFNDEATPGMPPIADPLAAADRWIAQRGRLAYLWDDAGETVAFCGCGGETPNGARIGPVYTPPEYRGRGYASSVTAAATQDQLERGRRFLFLFTDLANPTSNKIYQAIGYEPVCDMDQYRFEEADADA
jgi:uncharacterized protein